MKEPIHSPLDPEEESKRAVSPRVRLVAYARFIHDRTLERELNHRSIPETSAVVVERSSSIPNLLPAASSLF